METVSISWPLIIAYLVILLGIGIWAARTRVGNVEDMAVAGRNCGVWLIAFSVAATWINGVTLISLSGLAKNYGMGSFWAGGSGMIATMWFGYYIIPRLRETGIITLPQLFGGYFGNKAHLISLVLAMLRDLGATAGTMGVLAVITSTIFDISLVQALLIIFVLTLVYLFLGGMWAVLVTDAFQFLIVIIGSIALVWLAFMTMPVGQLSQNLSPEMLDVVGPAGFHQIAGWVVLNFVMTLGYQSVIQRGLAASSHQVARRGFLLGGAIGFVWYIVPTLLGLQGRALYGADFPAEDVFLRLTFDLGGVFGSIILISIIAASMSTLDSTINTLASNLSVDIYSRYLNKVASVKRQLWVYRFNIIIVGIIAALLYYFIPLMLELFWIGGRVMAASLSPALVAVVIFPQFRRAPKTVTGSMILGGTTVIVWQLFFGTIEEVGSLVVIWSLDPVLIGLPVSIISLMLGVRFENPGKPGDRQLQDRNVRA